MLHILYVMEYDEIRFNYNTMLIAQYYFKYAHMGSIWNETHVKNREIWWINKRCFTELNV